MKTAKQWLEDNRFAFTTQFSFNQVAKLMDMFLKESQQSEPSQPVGEVKTKRELIKTIIINSANLEHISQHNVINGTLLIEIERVMQAYTSQFKFRMPTKEEIIKRVARITNPYQSYGFKQGVDWITEINKGGK